MRQETAKKILAKVKEDYERIASEFSDTRQSLWEELESLGLYVKDGQTVLDLGCGNGRLYELFKDSPISYVGMDSCLSLVEKAKKKHENTTAKFLAGDALELPFKDDSFDAVFCIAALHHFPSKELKLQVLRNIRRVLKDGGFLLMTNWNLCQPRYWRYFLNYFRLGGIHSPKDILIPWKLRSGEKVWRYYYAFTAGELKRLAKKAGFKVIDCYYAKKGKKTSWLKGANLVLIAK